MPNEGDTVRVRYRGTLADGTEFDSSEGRDPLRFTVGKGEVIPGFESAVADLAVGESKTVTIPAEEAYGARFDDAVQTFPAEAFGSTPEIGWQVQLEAPDGQKVLATVSEIKDGEVVLDFNHPLAGEDLTFEIELVDVSGA